MLAAAAHLQLAWHQVALLVQHHHLVLVVHHVDLHLAAGVANVVLDVAVVLLGKGEGDEHHRLAATQLTLGVAQQLVGGLWQ